MEHANAIQLEDFPEEILSNVVEFLEISSFISLGQVCSYSGKKKEAFANAAD